MKIPAKLQRLFELGRLVDALFEEIEKAKAENYTRRFLLGTKKWKRRDDELDALQDLLIEQCTLSDDTKGVIAALEGVEQDTELTTETFNQVAVKFAAFKRLPL